MQQALKLLEFGDDFYLISHAICQKRGPAITQAIDCRLLTYLEAVGCIHLGCIDAALGWSCVAADSGWVGECWLVREGEGDHGTAVVAARSSRPSAGPGHCRHDQID